MGVSPAEPLSDRATEFTFELNKIEAVLFTVSDTSSNSYRGATCTDQLVRFEISCFLLSPDTILHTSKVRFLAFEALVISQFKHRPSSQIVIESISFF